MSKIAQIMPAQDWVAVYERPSSMPGREDRVESYGLPLVGWGLILAHGLTHPGLPTVGAAVVGLIIDDNNGTVVEVDEGADEFARYQLGTQGLVLR